MGPDRWGLMARKTARYEEVLDVASPPERVYNYLVYPDTLQDLDPSIAYWQPDELPPRVGTLNRIKLRVLGIPTFEAVSRFVEVDPPRRFVIEGVRPKIASTWRWTMECRELGSSGTRGISTLELGAPTWAYPFARIALAYFRRHTRRSMRTSLARLRPL